VLEQINLPQDAQYPLVIGNPFFLVTLWSRSALDAPEKGRATLRVRSPSGKISSFPEQAIDLERYQRARNRTGFQGFNVTEPGAYFFDVILVNDGASDVEKTVASLPLLIQPAAVEPQEVD
jgi:hypothetical protein